MLPDHIRLLLSKYHSGQCSEQEQAELFQWYEDSSVLEDKLEEELERNPVLLNRLHDEIFEGIRMDTSRKSFWKPVWIRAGSVAASIFLVLGITFWWSREHNSATIYSYGKSERVSLPDGSIVWLKPHSKLKYERKMMSRQLREVTFEGEAFFQVSHNPAKPFEVLTEAVKVRVLGTSFNLKSLPGDSLTETTLVSGKVQLESLGEGVHNQIALIPNQKAVYSKNRRSIEVNSIENSIVKEQEEKTTAEAAVSMIFDNRPVSEVLKAVEKKFGVKIYFREQDLKDCHITLDIEKESLNEILELLQITQRISYSIYNNEIYLAGDMCKP